MACNLTRGYAVDCKDSIGGLKYVYFCDDFSSNIRACATFNGTDALQMDTAGFANWDAYGTTTGSKMTVFRYDLRPGASNMNVTINSSAENGTTFYGQALSLTLPKLSVKETHEIKLICQNRVQIFIEDQNGNMFLIGMDNGVEVSGGTVVSGAARGDMSGYTLEFLAEEKDDMDKT